MFKEAFVKGIAGEFLHMFLKQSCHWKRIYKLQFRRKTIQK